MPLLLYIVGATGLAHRHMKAMGSYMEVSRLERYLVCRKLIVAAGSRD